MPQYTRSLPTTLQNFYEAHRVPETWGSPSVSGETFATWHQNGFFAAVKQFLQVERNVGSPSLSVPAKIGSLVLGLGFIATADRMIGHRNHQPGKPETRYFPQRAALAAGMYAVGAALLVANNGGGETEPSGGRSSKEAPEDSPLTWDEDDPLELTPSAQAFMDRYTKELINMSDEKYEQHKQTMQELADQVGLTVEELESIIFEGYRPEDN